MQMYQCPNCGRVYIEFQNTHYCGTCNHRLLKQEDIKNINNPELSHRNYNVVGKVDSPSTPTVTCPYCQSTDTSKIGTINRMASVGFFGFASKKIGKQWHCNNCKSDF